ncbi:MAG TPA: hypothetical protein PKC03_01805 [Dokdonella sp.]|jgi:hypothetical protein|nr:hypothetical protein [Dokdonella sp.]
MSNIDDFIIVNEADRGPAFATPIFQRKYRLPVPEFPHHVIAYHRGDDDMFSVGCYIHFTDCGDILLGGGACTDDRVLRRMSADQRDCVRAAGGLYLHTLKWSLRHFGDRFAAVFGYCGDALAERVDRAAGFESTAHDRLLVYWTREVEPGRKAQMVAKAFSFIPF